MMYILFGPEVKPKSMLEDLLARSAQPLDEIKANIYQIFVIISNSSPIYISYI